MSFTSTFGFGVLNGAEGLIAEMKECKYEFGNWFLSNGSLSENVVFTREFERIFSLKVI